MKSLENSIAESSIIHELDENDVPKITRHNITYTENANYPYSGISRTIITIGDTIPVVFAQSFENTDTLRDRCPDGTEVIGCTAKEVLGAVQERINDPKINRLLADISNKAFTVESLDYLDTVCAALCMDENGKILNEMNSDAVCDVVSALCGDKSQKLKLAEKVDHLRKYRERKYRDSLNRQASDEEKQLDNFESLRNISELSAENVVLVHVTKHKPIIDEQGNIILYPTAFYDLETFNEDGTPTKNAPVARGTIHFTVNSRVENHMFGSDWESSHNYIIVVNLADLIDNGILPVAANPVDTYFESNPGQALVLHGAEVIEPIDNETFDANRHRVTDTMRRHGAKDVFVAGPHYLNGQLIFRDGIDSQYGSSEEFSHAFSRLCTKEGILLSPLHMGTPDALTEVASYTENDVMQFPVTFASACSSNQRWAACNGRFPVRTNTPPQFDEDGFL